MLKGVAPEEVQVNVVSVLSSPSSSSRSFGLSLSCVSLYLLPLSIRLASRVKHPKTPHIHPAFPASIRVLPPRRTVFINLLRAACSSTTISRPPLSSLAFFVLLSTSCAIGRISRSSRYSTLRPSRLVSYRVIQPFIYIPNVCHSHIYISLSSAP